MSKFFMILGIIVVAWLALGVIFWIGKVVFWLAVVAGIAYVVATIVAKKQIRQR
ncbi:MAG: hypothetical protein ABI382_02735 [Nakamurella sp.]